jgi:PKD repeat protein/FtsP/CotA-like multicopper oxidase with cupredoxin domain
MKTRARSAVIAVATLITGLLGSSAIAETNAVVNMGNANTFICNLTATNLAVTIVTTNGAILVTNTVQAMVYKDENNPMWPMGSGIPVPVMNLTTGQMVICYFKNALDVDDEDDEGASIHWHGIELDNDSDGTGVTQDSVLAGQSYTYRFMVPRPGLFWFHSHMMPGNTTFAGMYGVIIIPNGSEPTLITNGVLPPPAYTFPLAMSDIEFATNNSYAPDYPIGTVGRTTNYANATAFQTINAWVEACHANPMNQEVCQAASVPGDVVLVNGVSPLAAPGSQKRVYSVPRNQNIRLQLMNEALSRTFRLRLVDASGNLIPMYRIGGQGGLLNNARLEGGVYTNVVGLVTNIWDTLYTQGEIILGSGERADVIAFATNNGPTLTLLGNPMPGSPNTVTTFSLSTATFIPSNYPIAYFQLNANNTGASAITNGTPILANTTEPVPSLSALSTNGLVDPIPLGLIGTNSSQITLAQSSGPQPSIDGYGGPNHLDGNLGDGSFLSVSNLPTSLYAHVGDLLQLSVRNTTSTAHPFHLHGFSLQPMAILSTNAAHTLLYTYNYNEFVDTIHVYNGQILVFRVSLDDRPKFCDQSPLYPNPNAGPVLGPCTDSNCGGALGRWLFHCHIFPHAGEGMISEIVVLENDSAQTNLSKAIQLPDISPTGVGVLATTGTGSPIVADDFLCTTSGPITGITFWGSWLNDVVDPNTTFELKFWTDVPSIPSSPGVQLWREVFPPGTYSNNLAGVISSETFYDPSQQLPPGNDTQVYQYTFSIPECDAFYQSYSNVYWLSVTAYPTVSNALFGWKTCITNDAWGDDSTWSATTNYPGAWQPLQYQPPNPYAGFSMDQSFALTTTVAMNCPAPVASFSGSPTSGMAPLPVTFTDASTGAISNRFWNFGDGNFTNVATAGVSHTYTTVGNYSVTLTVSGPCGTNTMTLTNYIAVTMSCPPPTANFNASPTNGPPPLSVSFNDPSSGTITNWFWNFGDGSTTNVTTPVVSHVYTNAGTYSVTLTVIGPCGSNTITKTNYIVVTSCPPPTAIFTGNPTSGSGILTVLFNSTTTGSVTNWFWNFGDGSTTNVPTSGVSHTYTNAGTYSVTLTVSGLCGTNTFTQANYITVLTTLQNWLIQYFGSTNNPSGAPGLDLFGTGMSNTNKFLAGFSPTNSAAYLHIISIVKTNKNVNIIYLGANGDSTWSPGIASRTNVLDFTTGTANGSYSSNNFATTGQTNILSGGTGLGLVTNMIDIGGATNKPSRYYRIRVLVP